jgi:hypothetical protein
VGYVLFRPTFYPFYFLFLVLCFGALFCISCWAFFISSCRAFVFFIPKVHFFAGGCSPVIATLSHTPVLASLSLSDTLVVCLSVCAHVGLLPLFSIVIREAGGEDYCVEPAQEHEEVILGDVSNGWLWSNFIHSFGLGGELGCGCGGCRINDMYMHFNKRSGLMAPLVTEDVYEIIMKVRFWFSPDTFLIGAPM